MAARDADPAEDPPVVEIMQQVGDRRVDLGEIVEGAMAKAAQQPAFDDTNRGLDFRLVTRASRPRRQDGAAIMRRHRAIRPVDLRIEVARLDDRHLGIVRNKQRRRAAEELQRLDMAFNPVGK